MIARFFIFIIYFCFNSYCFGASIDNAFKALKEFNYFKAKEQFLKSQKKYPSAAAFGMATIYSRQDNPFFNLDSANRNVILAEASYSQQKEKLKKKLEKYGFNYPAVIELRNFIGTLAYSFVLKNPTETAFNDFVHKFMNSNEFEKAVFKRDSISYHNAKRINTSIAFNSFLSNYPISSFAKSAKADFDLAQYREKTKDGKVQSFVNFVKECPINPYVSDAEDQIYKIFTEKNTPETFKNFIKAYPSNRNISNAWRSLYRVSISDYTETSINVFLANNPDYPFKNEITNDLELSKQQLVPLKRENLWGFANHKGDVVIQPQYDLVGFFVDGLAYASKNRKLGYINMANEIMIPFGYENAQDFVSGRAIVEKNGKSGMIDRTGKIILPFQFVELGNLSDGLVFGKKDSLFAYYDQYGFQRIPERFAEAFDFADKKALVIINGKQGLIDEYGSYFIAPETEELRLFGDSLYVFLEKEKYGIMRRNFEVVLPAIYDEIGILSQNRAIIIYGETLGYVNEKGIIVIPPKYQVFPNSMKFGNFSNGLAKVALLDKYGFIDLIGKVVCPINMVNLGQPSATLISFNKGKGWGYCDRAGKPSTLLNFEESFSFDYGVGITSKLTLFGLINSKGAVILPFEYTEIKRLDSKHLMIRRGPKYGIANNSGEIVVPVEYQQIRTNNSSYFLLIKSTEIDYFYKKDALYIKLSN